MTLDAFVSWAWFLDFTALMIACVWFPLAAIIYDNPKLRR